MHGMSKIFVSSDLNTREVSSNMVVKLNLDIENMCKNNSFHFIDNNNIPMNFLYKDGLHLLYSGKELLAKKIYFNINNFLRKRTKYIPSKYNPELEISSFNKENKELSEMESFRNVIKNVLKALWIGYLNINSLRNKIIDLKEIIKYLELDYFVISETKIDESFASQQFAMDNFEVRARKDRD